jgi:hypothetical protein
LLDNLGHPPVGRTNERGEAAGPVAGGLSFARTSFKTVVDGGSFDAHVFTVEYPWKIFVAEMAA